MNLTETLLLILVVLVSGMMLNQILEIRDLENQVKGLKKQLKNRQDQQGLLSFNTRKLQAIL